MATTIQLSPEAERRLDMLVSMTGHSREYYLHEIVERILEDLEDCYSATEALERVRRGEEEVYSTAEVGS